MNNPPTGNRKITLPQAITILLALVIMGLYRFFQSPDQTQTLPPTDAPIVQSNSQQQPTPLSSEPVNNQIPTLIPSESPQAAPTWITGKGFDFYVLSLSWSPDYCATTGQNDTQQCSLGKKLAFVLHGLWPQYQKGYPSSCSNEKLPRELKEKYPALYPSDNLYTHEWEKHGTCTGLTPDQYLALSLQVKQGVHIPSAYKLPEKPFRTTMGQLREQFIVENPGFEPDTIAVNCSGSGRFLKEIYICYSLEGKPTRCSQEVLKSSAKSCAQPDFLVRNIR